MVLHLEHCPVGSAYFPDKQDGRGTGVVPAQSMKNLPNACRVTCLSVLGKITSSAV